MNSKGTGLTLSLGIVAAIIGYVLWQVTIGFDTKVDDVQTILTNSAAGSTNLQISFILVCVGLVVHAAGLINTRGTASGTSESLGIVCIVAAIAVWVTSSGVGIALAEMGEKYVAAAGAGDAGAATAGSIAVAGGFAQSATVAANTLGGLLAGIGWVFMGLAYRSSDAKGALSFIPLGWLALITGLILVVSTLVVNPLVSIEVGSQISGISFILIVLWSVLRGIALIQEA
jgi:hypothetical protein